MSHDPVNHPSHYTSGKIEVIDFIEDQGLPYHLGNAIKYICRSGKKAGADEGQDIDKAVWYLTRYRGLTKKNPASVETGSLWQPKGSHTGPDPEKVRLAWSPKEIRLPDGTKIG